VNRSVIFVIFCPITGNPEAIQVADKWDEFFMSFWAQRRMKMGLGWEIVHA
jgi:hypothetical protein